VLVRIFGENTEISDTVNESLLFEMISS